MVLLELELRRVLDRHDALRHRDGVREDVQERRLAGAGTAGHQDVESGLNGPPQHVGESRRHGSIRDEIAHLQWIDGESPDRQHRAVQRQRRDDGIDPGAVRQAGVDHGRRFVDTAAHGRHDAVDDLQEMGVVTEDRVRPLELAAPLHVHFVGSVDEDVRDGGILHERLDGPQPERLVLDLADQILAFLPAQRRLVGNEHVLDDPSDLLLHDVAGQRRQLGQVEPLDELSMHPRF